MNKCPVMTTSAGNPVGDNQNSLTAGLRGPVLMAIQVAPIIGWCNLISRRVIS